MSESRKVYVGIADYGYEGYAFPDDPIARATEEEALTDARENHGKYSDVLEITLPADL